MRVLVTRAAAGAATTAARLSALRHEPIVLPLFGIIAVDWSPPADNFGALVLTSAAAAKHAGPALAQYRRLPCYCVGGRTADAARAAGLADVRTSAAGGVGPLFDAMLKAGVRRALHLRGRDVVDAAVPDGIEVDRRIVYDAQPRDWTALDADAAARAEIALIYSPRAAQRLAGVISPAVKARLRIAALSVAVADAAGTGWAAVLIAARPDEDALFAAADLLCENRAAEQDG